MINGNELVRYFSEIEDERYYSENEIEDLYEKAFSEGYEFAQREFGILEGIRGNLQRAVKGIENNIKSVPRKLERNKKYRNALKQQHTVNEQFLGPLQYDPKTGQAFHEVSKKANKYYTPESKEKLSALRRLARAQKRNPQLAEAEGYKLSIK